MTEIDYDRLNTEAKRLYDHAYGAGRSAGTEAENSRLARENAITSLKLAQMTIERAFTLPEGYREPVARLAGAILYHSCPVTVPPSMDQIRSRFECGEFDEAAELIRADLRVLKEGEDRA